MKKSLLVRAGAIVMMLVATFFLLVPDMVRAGGDAAGEPSTEVTAETPAGEPEQPAAKPETPSEPATAGNRTTGNTVRAIDRTAGDGAAIDRAAIDRTAVNRAAIDRTAGDRTASGRAAGDRTAVRRTAGRRNPVNRTDSYRNTGSRRYCTEYRRSAEKIS